MTKRGETLMMFVNVRDPQVPSKKDRSYTEKITELWRSMLRNNHVQCQMPQPMQWSLPEHYKRECKNLEEVVTRILGPKLEKNILAQLMPKHTSTPTYYQLVKTHKLVRPSKRETECRLSHDLDIM
ncbi:hypothetical protein OSTOST_01952 [Ostertagia ostertagi]